MKSEKKKMKKNKISKGIDKIKKANQILQPQPPKLKVDFKI